MFNLNCSMKSLLVAFFTLMLFSVAQAQTAPQRTFVSAQRGDDNNATNGNICNVTNPCRDFNAAIGVVRAGGEVIALDSGGYGPVTVSKAVTLTGPTGVYVAITAQTTDAIDVTAGSSDIVVLRGLTLRGLGGTHGINATSMGVLHVESCVLNGFGSGGGLYVHLSASAQVFVTDTVARNNDIGIQLSTTSGIVRASLDHCRAESNSEIGFYANNNAFVTVSNSVASGNGTLGFFVFTNAGATAELNADACVASHNLAGFEVSAASGSSATIRVKNSTSTNNTYGFNQFASGVFKSLVNNMVDGNQTNSSGTITTLSPM